MLPTVSSQPTIRSARVGRGGWEGRRLAIGLVGAVAVLVASIGVAVSATQTDDVWFSGRLHSKAQDLCLAFDGRFFVAQCYGDDSQRWDLIRANGDEHVVKLKNRRSGYYLHPGRFTTARSVTPAGAADGAVAADGAGAGATAVSDLLPFMDSRAWKWAIDSPDGLNPSLVRLHGLSPGGADIGLCLEAGESYNTPRMQSCDSDRPDWYLDG